MVEKYFKLNISSAVFSFSNIHFQEGSYGEKKPLHLRPLTYLHQELECRKGGCRGQKKKTLHAMKFAFILKYA